MPHPLRSGSKRIFSKLFFKAGTNRNKLVALARINRYSNMVRLSFNLKRKALRGNNPRQKEELLEMGKRWSIWRKVHFSFLLVLSSLPAFVAYSFCKDYTTRKITQEYAILGLHTYGTKTRCSLLDEKWRQGDFGMSCVSSPFPHFSPAHRTFAPLAKKRAAMHCIAALLMEEPM